MTENYRLAFLEEAAELLAELESALLELEGRPAEQDLIQRVFRALHTIKGSGAMFGFDEVSRFTHELESAYDRVREGQLPVSTRLVNLTLEACDQIRQMLEDAEAPPTERPGAMRIVDLLQMLVGSVSRVPEGGAGAAKDEREEVRRVWRIGFRPARELFQKGTNPVLLFQELGEMGKLSVKVDASGVPALAEMDAESCYLAWELTLETGRDVDAIRDVFLFVEDDCDLQIERIDAAAAVETPVQTPEAAVETKGSGAGKVASIRVAADKLDSLVNFVGELVIAQARLSQLAGRSDDPELVGIAEEVERLTSGLRDNTMSIRMLPLRPTFDRFRRLVHDLARELGKEVEFSTDGGDTELDKTVIEQLSDPLLHLVRNSMDHGLEPPAVRAAAGKPRPGRIHLSASYAGASVVIQVRDDGRGLDAEAIRRRAIEKRLVAPEAQLSESEIYSFILMPGFSTSEKVTGLSGRGVGMDVVRTSMEALHGSVEMSSRPGDGTTVTLRLPLTLAIIDGLLVRVAASYFVVPLASVVECVELTQEDVRRAHGKHLADLRGEFIPYIRLREYFRIGGERQAIEQIMIVEANEERFGFVVDEVLGDHQTVIKTLGRVYRHVEIFSGATILGDGTVALIVDPQRLVQRVTAAVLPARVTVSRDEACSR